MLTDGGFQSERYYSLVNGRPNISKYVDVFTMKAGQVPANPTYREKSPVGRVVHNGPATIIFWKDGSKTVAVQHEGDIWDDEKGFVFAYIKRPSFNYKQFCWDLKHFVCAKRVGNDE